MVYMSIFYLSNTRQINRKKESTSNLQQLDVIHGIKKWTNHLTISSVMTDQWNVEIVLLLFPIIPCKVASSTSTNRYSLLHSTPLKLKTARLHRWSFIIDRMFIPSPFYSKEKGYLFLLDNECTEKGMHVECFI